MSTKHEVRRKITLTEDEETGLWSAVDEEEGVASQGETRHEALENLDKAVALYKGEIGREPTDEELREVGIEPEDNETGGELPDVLN
ncbi:type II toxin-antitoxin system HicB family antitoxin [Haladaptatus sp. F3-133]|uniref:Type II toxin-antitoxin system HicB family antitoxin n=1 Tax=Halorutilus salinus TaxID=2487751 RepID=A0A9Q4C6K8_9EURY|nr:type II toxin-antitoxin system HicB family antitoxin [Halorutilus salinus]MCX2819884.1 type II toxin-antitoxin system HicB family antitoxin [Halorutilus salinus]